MDKTEVDDPRNGAAIPPHDLRPWVSGFVGRAVWDKSAQYHIFPNARTELFFNFGEHATSQSLENPYVPLGVATVFGPRYGPYFHAAGAVTDWFLIQLTPLGVRAAIGCPTAVLPNADIPLTDARPNPESLIEKLANAHTFGDRCGIATDWMRAVVRDHLARAGNTRLSQVAESIRHGTLETLGISEELGLTDRQARHNFRSEMGISPKTFQMLFRVERAWANLYAGIPRNLCAEGYADDSHLSRDFVRFTGIRPSDYLTAKRAGDRLINGVTVYRTDIIF